MDADELFLIGAAVEGLATYQENGKDVRHAATWGVTTTAMAWVYGLALAGVVLGWLFLVASIVGGVWDGARLSDYLIFVIPLVVVHLIEWGARRLRRRVWRLRCESVEANRLAREPRQWVSNQVIDTTCTDSDQAEWTDGPAWQEWRRRLYP